MSNRIIKYIVIHCSATPPHMDIGAKEIKEWHLKRGWKDIGYHYVIRRNGWLEHGRKEAIAGAHVKGWNKNSIGICYVGGVNLDNKPSDNRTDAQNITLVNLLKLLKKRYPAAIIKGHRDFPGVAKACPSFNVKEEYGWLNESS